MYILLSIAATAGPIRLSGRSILGTHSPLSEAKMDVAGESKLIKHNNETNKKIFHFVSGEKVKVRHAIKGVYELKNQPE